MPTYKVTHPYTNKSLKITGNKPPSEQELNSIFDKVQPKTVGGFVKNVGKSAGRFVGDIAKAVTSPVQTLKNVGNLAVGAGQLLIPGEQGKEDVARGVGNYYKNRYTKDIKDTLYYDPVGVASDVATLAGGVAGGAKVISKVGKLSGAGKIAEGAGNVARVAKGVETVTDPLLATNKAVGMISGKTPIGKMFSRAKEGVKDFGENYAIKSTRIPSKTEADLSRKIGGLKTRFGKNTQELIRKSGLYGQDLDKINEYIRPLQEKFEALQSGKKIKYSTIIDEFDKRIDELSKPSALRDPAIRSLRDFLQEERDTMRSGLFRGGTKIESLVETRKSIDKNTPQKAFDVGGFNKQNELADIYRQVINESAGTTDIGKELSALYAFKKAVEKAPKGKNTKPLGLERLLATAGGVGFGNSLIGKIVGAVGMNAAVSVINNPSFIGAVSRLAKTTTDASEFIGKFMEIYYQYSKVGSRVNNDKTFSKPKKVTTFSNL